MGTQPGALVNGADQDRRVFGGLMSTLTHLILTPPLSWTGQRGTEGEHGSPEAFHVPRAQQGALIAVTR